MIATHEHRRHALAVELGRTGVLRVLEQATNTVAPTQLAELESKPVRFEDVCDVDEMAGYVESAAKKMTTN